MDPHALLQDTLDRRFPDGARRAVLVIGAGLHHHLAAHTAGDTTTEQWRLFKSWNELLRSVGAGMGTAAAYHQDPTATWESLVVEGTRRQPRRAGGTSAAAREVEKVALRGLGKQLGKLPSERDDRRRLGRALRRAGYRDLVSLNFDRTLEQSLGLKLLRPDPSAGRRARLVARDAQVRVWYPHGHMAAPDAIVLGHRAYGMAIEELEGLRDRSKQADREWRAGRTWTAALRDAWEQHRRAPDNEDLSWMDLFLLSDLIFIGCSLDRAEMDLWWALHQRARNHAQQPAENVPRTLVMHGPGGAGDHLTTGPAGVVPVPFGDWNEVWAALIGRWWDTSG